MKTNTEIVLEIRRRIFSLYKQKNALEKTADKLSEKSLDYLDINRDLSDIESSIDTYRDLLSFIED